MWIECDFQRIYHLDLTEALPARSWRWFAARVTSLLQMPDSLLHGALSPHHR